MAYVFISSYATFEARSSSRPGDITDIVKGVNFMPPSAPRESQCKAHINCDPWLTHVLKGRDNGHVFSKFINVLLSLAQADIAGNIWCDFRR